MVVRNRVQVDETVNGLINEIKKFFRLRNPDLSLEISEDNEGIYYTIEPKEWVKISGEKFDRFFDLMKGLGFYWLNGAENRALNCTGYEYIIGSEEFGNDDGVKVYVSFSEEKMKGKDRVYIKHITIEKKRPGDNSVG